MPDPARLVSLEPTFTDQQVADNLHKTVRWVRERARSLGLDVMQAGNTMLFTASHVESMKEAMRSRYRSAGGVKSTTRAARYASGVRSSASLSSAQVRAIELAQKLLPPRKRPESAKTPLKALQGGRGVSP